jgi:hypothetical protein
MGKKDRNAKFKLKQPDRSGPSDETLLGFAEKAGILQSNGGGDAGGDDEVLIGRVGEAMLWCVSLTMLHFTLDVLVANQYAVDIEWPKLLGRMAQAFPGK